MLKGLRANAILTIVVALLLSAFLARQEQSRASRSEESASGKTPITSPSRMAPKGIPDNPTLSRKEFLSVEERLGLENPPPLLLESLNVLLSPPMIAEIQAEAVETRIQWETEGLDHLPELLTVLQDEAPETRVLAAILLGSLRSPEVIPHLENRLKVEQSELVRCALLAGLADCGQTPREHGEK